MKRAPQHVSKEKQRISKLNMEYETRRQMDSSKDRICAFSIPYALSGIDFDWFMIILKRPVEGGGQLCDLYY